MTQARSLPAATRRATRALAVAGALLTVTALPSARAVAQAPVQTGDASLCPPPPRRLTFAISATGAKRKPVRRKPAVAGARPAKPATVVAVKRVRPAAVRPKKRPARAKSIVPVPSAATPAKAVAATAVCKPWKHELAAPLVGLVASAETPATQLPLVAGATLPFLDGPPAVVEDDSSSVAPFWWMIPAGGIVIAGVGQGGGGEAGGIAGVEVGRGASGTPVIPGETLPPVVEDTPGAGGPPSEPGSDGSAPSDPGANPGGPTGEPPVVLPPPPPVGSTTPPGEIFPPAGPPSTVPPQTPDGPPGGPPGTPPGGDGPNGPPPGVKPPEISTAVVPEPAPLGMVLVGGSLVSLIAWGVARRP